MQSIPSITKPNSDVTADKTLTLRASAVTWNLAEKTPYPEDVSVLRQLSADNDIIVIGCQECEEISPLRRQESEKSKAWRSFQRRGLSKTHKCLQEHTLGGVQLAIYVSKTTLEDKSKPKIKVLDVFDVACGIGNVLPNKGGICVTLGVGNKKIGIFSAHFAAHQNKVKQRNADFNRIMSSLDEYLAPQPSMDSSHTWYTSRSVSRSSLVTARSNNHSHSRRKKGNLGPRFEKKKGKKKNNKMRSRRDSEGYVDDGNPRTGRFDGDDGPNRERQQRRDSDVTDMDFRSLNQGVRDQVGIRDIPSSLDTVAPVLDEHSGDENDQSSDDVEEKELFPMQLRTTTNTIITRVPVQPKMALHFDDTYDTSLKYLQRNFDAMVFVGDLNYRLDLPRLEIERIKEEFSLKYPAINQEEDLELIKAQAKAIKKGRQPPFVDQPSQNELQIFYQDLESVIEYDQLYKQRSIGNVFTLFEEHSVSFLPTYKYDKGKSKYDSSAKQRSPAWTDRILKYERQSKDLLTSELPTIPESTDDSSGRVKEGRPLIECIRYDVARRCFPTTDHRPVRADFVITLQR